MSYWSLEKWEQQNQDTLKGWYEQQQIDGNGCVRKLICGGCGRLFYTQSEKRKYCDSYRCGNIATRRRVTTRRVALRQNLICCCCGKQFSPKRVDAKFCSNACRQKSYRQRVTDAASVLKGHLQQP